MNIDDIFRWYSPAPPSSPANPHRPRILRSKRNYPGSHLNPQPRTNPAHKPLEPLSQVRVTVTRGG